MLNIKWSNIAAPITSLLFAIFSATASAVPVTTLLSANVSYSENGTSASSAIDPSSSVSVYQGSPTFDSYAEANGDQSGTTDALSWSHAEYAQVVSQVHQVSTVLNNTGSAQRFTFRFLVDSGMISATANNPLISGEYLNANYDMNILVNGRSIWQSSANLYLDADGYVLTKSGMDLHYGATASAKYQWDDYKGRLNLGTFKNNESFTLEYYLTATVTNHFYVYENQSCGEGDVYVPDTTPNCSQSFNGQSYAHIGDPNGFEHSPISSDTVVPGTNVPEPAAAWLLLLGLAGLGISRRYQ